MRPVPLSPRSSGAALAALLVTLAPSLSHAQAYQRIAPREPQAATSPSVTPPSAAAASSPSGAAILPVLKGLVFVPGMSALQPAGLPAGSASDGVHLAGTPLLNDPGFSRRMTAFIGRPLSFADLQKIIQITTNWYRAHGRPFVSVVAPPQNVGSGVVQIVVSEYRLGTVKAAGNRWFASDLLRRESGLVPGQPLTLGGVQDDLDRLNSNPFRAVNTVFQPGAEPGVTDVVLQTQDRRPVRVYAAFDDAGAANLGRTEWSIGAVWGNAFGLDQILSYQFTRGVSGRYDANAASWSIPLPWHDTLLVFGSYASETPDLGANFGERGTSGQASARYIHPLPRLTWPYAVSLTQSLQVGYDFKTTNNNLEFGGAQVFASRAEVDQFPLVYDATLTDPRGQTGLENQIVLSPGALTGGNSNQAFGAIVPGATADYIYDRLSVTRTTYLPRGFSWSARATGQVSDRNLMYSEQLGAGGMDSVRGYYTDTALGSRGLLVSQEVRAPAIALGGLLHLSPAAHDQEQLGLFWDYGHVEQVKPIPNSVNAADLSSVGVDLHATLDRYIDLKLDIGGQLRNAPGADKRGVFADVAMVVGF